MARDKRALLFFAWRARGKWNLSQKGEKCGGSYGKSCQRTEPTPCDLEGRKLREEHSDITLFLPSGLPLLPCISQIQLKAKGQGGL